MFMRKNSLVVVLILILSMIRIPVLGVNAGELTGMVEPPPDLGVVSVGSNVVLEFGANFSHATRSMAIVLVNNSDVAFTLNGFTAKIGEEDIIDQFDLTYASGRLLLNCSSIHPMNDLLRITIVFKAGAFAGNYTFDWWYVYVNYQEPPDPPRTVDVRGATEVEVFLGIQMPPICPGWNLLGINANDPVPVSEFIA